MINQPRIVAFFRRHYWPILVVLAPMLVFLPVCTHDFVSLDDHFNVYTNAFVANFSWANLVYFWTGTYDYLYAPLTYNVWMVVALISRLLHPLSLDSLDPHVFHAANLLLHCLNALLIFQILKMLLRDQWGAAAGALLFAIHPVQVEVVAWVTGMKDVLSGFWVLVSLWCYLRYSLAETTDTRRRWWYAAATASYGLALLAKPSAVVLPLLAGIVALYWLRLPWRRLLRELLPWVVLAVPMVVVTKSVQDGSVQYFQPSFWQRFLVAGDAVSFYLGKLLLPLSLAIDYGRTPQYVLGQGWVYLTGILPYLLAIFLFWKSRRDWARVSALLFVAPLLPVLGFIPFNFQVMSTVADRYLYLSMLGVALSVGWVLAHYRRRGVVVAALLVLALLGMRSILQLPNWENSEAFYRHTLAVNAKSWVSYLNQGIILKNQGEHQRALQNFQKVLEYKTDNPMAYSEMGDTYNAMGNREAAAATYQQALKLSPAYAEVLNKLGKIYYQAGKKEEAIEYLKKAVEMDAGSVFAAAYYADLGLAFSGDNKIDWAIHAYRKALALNPYLEEAHSSLGDLYLGRNETALAMEMYNQELKVNPGSAAAYNGLGMAYSLVGRKEQAVSAFLRAIELNPKSGRLYNNLAVVYQEMGQPGPASRYAAQAKNLGFAPAQPGN